MNGRAVAGKRQLYNKNSYFNWCCPWCRWHGFLNSLLVGRARRNKVLQGKPLFVSFRANVQYNGAFSQWISNSHISECWSILKGEIINKSRVTSFFHFIVSKAFLAQIIYILFKIKVEAGEERGEGGGGGGGKWDSQLHWHWRKKEKLCNILWSHLG